MAARKRNSKGHFVKGGGTAKKGKKKARKATSSGGGSSHLALLHSIDKKVSRIDHRMSMPARLRLGRMKSAQAARKAEEALAAKYG